MTVLVPVIRLMAPVDRRGPGFGTAVMITSAAVDALACGVLLLRTAGPPLLAGLVAALLHGLTILLVSRLACARPGRRWLCIAAALTVPCVGAAIVFATLATRGRGLAAPARRKMARRRPRTMLALQRLAAALSPCEALCCGDDEERHAALSALSLRRDPGAVALLRWATASRDPDLALSAALALDEIGERAEREASRLDRCEARRAVG